MTVYPVWIKLLIKAGAADARGEGEAFETVCANFFMVVMTAVGLLYSLVFWLLGLPILAKLAPIPTLLYPWGILWNAYGKHVWGKIWILLTFNCAIIFFSVIGGGDTTIHLGFFIVICLCFILFGNWRVALPLSLLPMLSMIGTQTLQTLFEPLILLDSRTSLLVKLCVGQTIMMIFSSVLIFARFRIRSLENELRAMIARRENLLALLSHDIRNPLTVTIANLGLLQSGRYRAQPAVQQAKLQKALYALSRIDILLRSVRSLLAIQVGKIKMKQESHAVQVLLDQVQELCSDKLYEKQLRLVVDNQNSDYTRVQGDADLLLLSVFGNILSNAIKFSPRGALIRIHSFSADQGVIFDFIDQGVGIKPQLLPYLFSDDHPTTSPGTENESGTGFGLPLAAEVARLHGGRIEVKSPLGSGPFPGSRFRVILPQS